MNVSQKVSSLQAYNLALYRGAIHPEFFDIEGRKRITHGDYEFEAWAFKGGHLVRFELDGICLTEIVTDNIAGVPDRGHVITLPCAGERDHEDDFGGRFGYMTSIQTETLTGHLFLGTYNEMLEHGSDPECISVNWSDPDNAESQNLTVLDTQRYADEVHIQAYHLRRDCGLVLRTQSIFQLKTERKD